MKVDVQKATEVSSEERQQFILSLPPQGRHAIRYLREQAAIARFVGKNQIGSSIGIGGFRPELSKSVTGRNHL